MDRRIQQALDQEIPREWLTQAEVGEVAAAEAMIDHVLGAVPVRRLPDLGPAVLHRLEGMEPGRRNPVQSLLDWFWKPRPISLHWRPAYAFGVMGLFACVALFNPWSNGDAVLVPSPSKVLVQFRLDAPAARTVMLAGDFTDWQPQYPLTRSAPGVWTIVVPLNPGVHDYAFVIDGNRWTPDPLAPPIADGFGGVNSRVAVLSPDVSSL